METLGKNHNLQHMCRALPSPRVKTISPRSIEGVWAGLSVLVSIKTHHGKRCPVSMREGTVATRVTVIMMGMIDCAGNEQSVLYTPLAYTALH